jgi:hypothetical protein
MTLMISVAIHNAFFMRCDDRCYRQDTTYTCILLKRGSVRWDATTLRPNAVC